MAAPDLIPLNRSEHMYWAAEGYLGPINIPFVLRFDAPVSTELMRQTMRELATAFPRMRGVIEPTAFSYKLRILSDERQIDQLFDNAFRVQPGVDASSREALRALHDEFMNHSICMERGLPWVARFVPHPTQPALLFAINHIIGDGRSMVQMLCAIMARLSGQPMTACQVDNPTMLPAVMPPKWWQWPANIARWWRNSRADKAAAHGRHIVTLNRQPSTRYTTTGICYHDIPCPADTMKALAKRYGTTVNTLLTAIVGNTFLALAEQDPQATAAIRISVDLRRYFPKRTAPEFGNFVHSFTILANRQASMGEQINDLENQVKTHLARYSSRDYALPLLFYELLPLLGRRLFSYLIFNSKVKGSLPTLSCHFSNLGACEFINPKDASVRLHELWPATLSTVFLIGAVILNGKQFLCLVHQKDEIPHEAVEAFRAEFDRQIQRVMQESQAT
ncbi:hypothetical protein JY96_10350 [Aquabacterium sp. NJ1]|uniref:hypothetical protein n=1 Tax=Aquabacterium sp. NJ1 TaxID=1538295 RepID=UPI00052D0520|nr:hypothetical protein [Aquabacterium sp. NJ1]KGM40295.1 hypothetical protein JY96_10350 [Aquabacterium sp. NJ1]